MTQQPVKIATIILVLLALLIPVSLLAASNILRGYEAGVFSKSSHTVKPGKRLISQGSKGIIPTNTFPANLGTQFGVRYSLEPSAYKQDIELDLLYLTPGIIDSKGNHIDRIEVTKKIDEPAEYHVMAYHITQGYEAVPGEWRFMIFLEDRKLLDHTFTVTPEEK